MARGSQAEKKRSSKKQPVEFVTLESEGEEPVYEVERIVDSRIHENGMLQYQLKWKGYSDEENTWEFEYALSCASLVQEFLDKQKKDKQASEKFRQQAPKRSRSVSNSSSLKEDNVQAKKLKTIKPEREEQVVKPRLMGMNTSLKVQQEKDAQAKLEGEKAKLMKKEKEEQERAKAAEKSKLIKQQKEEQERAKAAEKAKLIKQQKEEQERAKVEAERAKLIQEEQEERDRLKLEIENAALKTRSEKGDRLRTKLVAEPNNNAEDSILKRNGVQDKRNSRNSETNVSSNVKNKKKLFLESSSEQSLPVSAKKKIAVPKKNPSYVRPETKECEVVIDSRGFERGLKPAKIVGLFENSTQGPCFLMKWEDDESNDLVPKEEANMICPELVIAFYEKRFRFKE